jgi:hypothetical protein
LGERLLCKQEVVGSIPSASTIINAWPGPCAWSFAPRKRRRSFFDIVHRKRSESLDFPALSPRQGGEWVNKAVCVSGVVPCTERAVDDRKIVIADKREIKRNKGVWRMPWH